MTQNPLTPSDIGELVRKTRKAMGLRQDELAGAAGVGLHDRSDFELKAAILAFGARLLKQGRQSDGKAPLVSGHCD